MSAAVIIVTLLATLVANDSDRGRAGESP